MTASSLVFSLIAKSPVPKTLSTVEMTMIAQHWILNRPGVIRQFGDAEPIKKARFWSMLGQLERVIHSGVEWVLNTTSNSKVGVRLEYISTTGLTLVASSKIGTAQLIVAPTSELWIRNLPTTQWSYHEQSRYPYFQSLIHNPIHNVGSGIVTLSPNGVETVWPGFAALSECTDVLHNLTGPAKIINGMPKYWLWGEPCKIRRWTMITSDPLMIAKYELHYQLLALVGA